MKVVKPESWPSNPYEEEIAKFTNKKRGGLFKVLMESFKSTLSGQSNHMLTMSINKSIVDYRDQRILNYIRNKKNAGVDLNMLF
uniref:Uncharacterized protein n=1 Tax=viral metagenome TaxID=1070528 RepID=A0A6M3L890_9ZZZZ